MSTQTLSAVAVHVVGQYHEAGKTLVGAWRTGARRLLDGAASRYGQMQKVTEFLANRLDIDTGRVVSVLDRMAEAGTQGIEAVAGRAARAESPIATSLVSTFSAIHLPIANVHAQIADKIAEGARKLETRVAGAKEAAAEQAPEAKGAAVAVAKTARRARRTAA
ncbi:hypothetical protein QTI33_33965 [Variovorax sp. J22P271]|uniref:hypothetical protein n=1 Tax=Variovorax davisae TaxID=3053515 RepID=UPI00257646B5|nr:hypothetical protein [Variovorax sp. J22P271]MDM0037179.1 hypothetical protein [Variovorax sp. J22P271]